MVQWNKYRDFGRITQLRNGGRELLGKHIWWTEKRDGSNVSFWIDDNNGIRISSHNMEAPTDESFINNVLATNEYNIVLQMFQEAEFKNKILYFEMITPGKGPTRIEPPHKYCRLVLIDIYDTITQKYLTYTYCHQVAHKYKLPIVKLVNQFVVTSMDLLFSERDNLLKWCKRHRREGVVGKVWFSDSNGNFDSIFVKEKIDLPPLRRSECVEKEVVQKPRMPDDKIWNAIDQAREECERAGNSFRNPKFGMPLVVTHLHTQAKEHDYAVPSSMFNLYQEYIEKHLKEPME